MGMTHAILHPGEGQQQTIAIILFVVEFQIQQLVVTVYGATLDNLVASEDTIDDMYIRIGRAHLHSYRLTIVRKLGGRLPEPVVSLRSGSLIIKREYHKLALDGVVLANCLKGMLARGER